MVLVLRLLILRLTWIASPNLVISTQHCYSAQIDFDMREFNLVLFRHWDIIMCLVSKLMKEKKMPLITKHKVWLKIARQWRYLTDKKGFLFIGTHGIDKDTPHIFNISGIGNDWFYTKLPFPGFLWKIFKRPPPPEKHPFPRKPGGMHAAT